MLYQQPTPTILFHFSLTSRPSQTWEGWPGTHLSGKYLMISLFGGLILYFSMSEMLKVSFNLHIRTHLDNIHRIVQRKFCQVFQLIECCQGRRKYYDVYLRNTLQEQNIK